jgi:hypothetical protein
VRRLCGEGDADLPEAVPALLVDVPDELVAVSMTDDRGA